MAYSIAETVPGLGVTGHRVTSSAILTGSGHGSKILIRFHLYSIGLSDFTNAFCILNANDRPTHF